MPRSIKTAPPPGLLRHSVPRNDKKGVIASLFLLSLRAEGVAIPVASGVKQFHVDATLHQDCFTSEIASALACLATTKRVSLRAEGVAIPVASRAKQSHVDATLHRDCLTSEIASALACLATTERGLCEPKQTRSVAISKSFPHSGRQPANHCPYLS